MANIKAKDADGNDVYAKATGDGTNGNPFIPQQTETNSAAVLAAAAAIQTACQLMDDAVITDGALKGILAAGHDGTNPQAISVDANGRLKVAIVDGSGNQITSFGGATLKQVITAVTRPANTTPYTAGDVFTDSTYQTIAIADSNGAVGRIADLALTFNEVPSPRPTFRVFFFNEAPASFADNAAFTLSDSDLAKLAGWVEFPGSSADVPGISGTTNLVYPCPGSLSTNGIFFKCASDSPNIYAYIVNVDGRTPVASEVINLKVGAMFGC